MEQGRSLRRFPCSDGLELQEVGKVLRTPGVVGFDGGIPSSQIYTQGGAYITFIFSGNMKMGNGKQLNCLT